MNSHHIILNAAARLDMQAPRIPSVKYGQIAPVIFSDDAGNPALTFAFAQSASITLVSLTDSTDPNKDDITTLVALCDVTRVLIPYAKRFPTRYGTAELTSTKIHERSYTLRVQTGDQTNPVIEMTLEISSAPLLQTETEKKRATFRYTLTQGKERTYSYRIDTCIDRECSEGVTQTLRSSLFDIEWHMNKITSREMHVPDLENTRELNAINPSHDWDIAIALARSLIKHPEMWQTTKPDHD
ncbi:hypothetical protein [Acetobacter pasteurianus]|uniref:hypothetical protein n=1 Tax=Acetobacter pasteurianus TaxID=438 RepID=UPI001362C931|nr:hypothetical protein [Acetobacter pasteurianus]QHM90099.1 hypothetical protein FCN51_00435 [Acetobacter pasteurianus]